MEAEAGLRSRTLSADQARSVGCRPILWGDGSEAGSPEPEHMPSPGPSPTHRPRAPEPSIAARVNGAWDHIERWLGVHASATLRSLGHPASAEAVAKWERERGARIPDELYASLLRHNGVDDGSKFGLPTPAASSAFRFPPAHGLLDLWSIGNAGDTNCESLVMAGTLREADPERGRWHGSLVPFAASDEGSELFVNPRSGRVGVKVRDERVRYEGPSGWPSYPTLLEAVAASLESGTALRGHYPTVTATCELRWAGEPSTSAPSGCAGGPRPSPTPEPKPSPPPRPPKLTPEQARAVGCRPERHPPVVRRPNPSVAARVNAVWRRIERRLAREFPDTHRSLNGPADPRAIAEAEARMGVVFPDDLRASLLRHNGAKHRGAWFGPAPFYGFMPVKAIADDWRMLCDIVVDNSATGWWHGRLIPFAGAPDGGNLFADPATGKTGEFYQDEGLTLEGDVAWPSYLALLEATATALETGRPIRSWRPAVNKGTLDWVEAGD
ncbi:SMI1/KNR4 family protein [Rhizohabitans arisaemae]|uniref:SMI1/KNR4 family protein n=1 Tax=Rhizohabitans arisaemae TaxID=2720610 RepID=UPI0024B1AEA3|nr:SMI1/KNR4 family protein [Rhizohabitans arisaemae]